MDTTASIIKRPPDNRRVTKSNDLIEASYRLTLDELRLVHLCVARVDSRKSVPARLTVTADDFGKTYHIDMKSAYSQLADAAERLWEREIVVFNGDNGDRHKIRWLQEKADNSMAGRVVLRFSSAVNDYLGDLKVKYTSYPLQQIAGFSSVNSVRIFELLAQYKSFRVRTVSLTDFREYLGIEEVCYQQFADLKKRVIDPAIAEIRTKANSEISFTTIRQRRKIVGLVFTFHLCEQLPLF